MRLVQRGTMWLRPKGRAVAFTAEHVGSTSEVEFTWDARAQLAPGLWMTAQDALRGGHGHLEGRLWNRVRVLHSVGPWIDLGQRLRYLAELPWNPYAMRANRSLRWRVLDRDRVAVATAPSGGVEVELTFDETGDIVQSYAPARPFGEGRAMKLLPWGGTFGPYATFDGLRLPQTAEVWWDLPSGRFVYWRGEITEAERVA